MGEAYGFFEIPSTTAAIHSVDVMCKTAGVQFVTWEKKLGGRLVTVIIKGDVSSVDQAIESAAANALIEPAGYCVIANPHEEIINMINNSAGRVPESGGY